MSLLIKGMDMPYCCVVCPFKEMYTDGLLCKATKPHQYIPKFLHKRNEKCPLAELPATHGRLIDADKFLEWLQEFYPNHVAIMSGVKNAKTIVEAEGGKTK